jgi:hypothetical protein
MAAQFSIEKNGSTALTRALSRAYLSRARTHSRGNRGKAMKSLIDQPITSLKWEATRTGPEEFELTGNTGIYATLSFPGGSHILARVHTAENAWTLKHLGILTPVVTLREEGGQVNVAIFHPHALRHGELRFQDGGSYDWVWLHDDEGTGAFLDERGKPLVRLQAHAGRDAHASEGFERCEVTLSPNPASHSRSALLAAFGWYLLLFDHLKKRDAVVAETTLRL